MEEQNQQQPTPQLEKERFDYKEKSIRWATTSQSLGFASIIPTIGVIFGIGAISFGIASRSAAKKANIKIPKKANVGITLGIIFGFGIYFLFYIFYYFI